jgi:hypothetical protein
MTGREQLPGGGLLKNLLDWVGIRGFIYGPLERRISVKGALEAALKKPIPHASWWSCFGGIAFLLFLVQAATGILLMFYYIPADPEAHRRLTGRSSTWQDRRPSGGSSGRSTTGPVSG